MASMTRSTRRAEGLHPHQVHANAHVHGPLTRSGPGPTPAALFQRQNQSHHHQVGRTKRALDGGAEHDFEAIKPKKSRIAVEILARLPTQPPSQPPPQPPHQHQHQHHAQARQPPHAPVPPQAAAPPPPPPSARPPVATANRGTQQPQPPAPAPEHDPNLTKHQAKVINGIKHELDRLQPQGQDTKEQGRKLRSQEATRFKSELSAYFPDYDEVIGNDPKEQHTLNLDTPIVVVDSNPRRVLPEPPRGTAIAPHYHQIYSANFPVRGYGDALFNDVSDAQRIDFGFLEAQHKNKNIEDPLPDSLFEPIHKRAERLERSIRNTEKGRAQHEKDQIIRLLEGLQGHDWLRVMGVSGITETKKKSFESAREYFLKGCQAILDKFRNWSLEEKKRKLEKERAIAELAEEQEEEEENAQKEEEVDQEAPVQGVEVDEEASQEDVDDDGSKLATSQDDTSEASSPAKQLRQEALARSKLAAANARKSRSAARSITPKPPDPPRVFTSFFSKKYEREGALNRHRRPGRKVLAWGHPIPEIPEADFILPEEYRDEETLKARERRKRRDRRGSRH